jgi:hypothetical protein
VEKRGKLMADGWSRTPAWPEAKSSLGSRKISGRVFQQNPHFTGTRQLTQFRDGVR